MSSFVSSSMTLPTTELQVLDMNSNIPATFNDGGDRAEQKRQRERRRRSDLSEAFLQLNLLLDEVDVDYTSEGDDIAARVDTVRRANNALRRLMRDNSELKHSHIILKHVPETQTVEDTAARYGWAVHRAARSSQMVTMERAAATHGLFANPAAASSQMLDHVMPNEGIAHHYASYLRTIYARDTATQRSAPSMMVQYVTKESALPNFTPESLLNQSLISVAHGLPPNQSTWMPPDVGYTGQLDHCAAQPLEPNSIPGLDLWQPSGALASFQADDQLAAMLSEEPQAQHRSVMSDLYFLDKAPPP